MKNLLFRYDMTLLFDAPVSGQSFTLRCVPRSDTCQTVRVDRISVFPKESLSEGTDSFGNFYLFGSARDAHSRFSVTVSGTAVTGLCSSLAAPAPHCLGLYRMPTVLTSPGPAVRALYARCEAAMPSTLRAAAQDAFIMEGTALAAANLFMDIFRSFFSYRSGATDVRTCAEDAIALGCGVCQDYAHILLALCRMAGIPARYVAGMLLGEGASHAWIEIADHGRWYALDPTAGTAVTDGYIRLAVGRDYADCPLNRGIFRGNARQTQQIRVSVTEETFGK